MQAARNTTSSATMRPVRAPRGRSWPGSSRRRELGVDETDNPVPGALIVVRPRVFVVNPPTPTLAEIPRLATDARRRGGHVAAPRRFDNVGWAKSHARRHTITPSLKRRKRDMAMDPETTKAVLGVASQLATDVYKDAAQPAVRRVGTALDTLFKIGLSPVAMLDAGYEHSKAWLEEKIRARRADTPADCVIVPPNNIAIPALARIAMSSGRA